MTRKANYPSRFLGRHLQEAVQLLTDEREFDSEAAVARSLDTEPSTFNRWINGYAHPRTREDWDKLTRLGLSNGFLRRLERLDKLDAWRRDLGITTEKLVELSVQLQAQEQGSVIFRVSDRRGAGGHPV